MNIHNHNRGWVRLTPRVQFRELTLREQQSVRDARAAGWAFVIYDAHGADVSSGRPLRIVRLDEIKPVLIGRAADNDIAIGWDACVSGAHAKIVREARTWFLEDLAAKNGTFLNRDRVTARSRLHDRDIITLGIADDAPRLVFFAAKDLPSTVAGKAASVPQLTRSERRLLAALCMHVLCDRGDEPASGREMAAVLCLLPESIRTGLTPVFAKFGLKEAPQRQKSRLLARRALDELIITCADLPMDCREIDRRLSELGDVR